MFTRDRDDMHLGPEAMKMIGKGIAKDLRESGGRFWGLENVGSSNKTDKTDSSEE